LNYCVLFLKNLNKSKMMHEFDKGQNNQIIKQKVLVVGYSNVGKSCIVKKHMQKNLMQTVVQQMVKNKNLKIK
jgi:GTP-binding protein EngB required for normal cell division